MRRVACGCRLRLLHVLGGSVRHQSHDRMKGMQETPSPAWHPARVAEALILAYAAAEAAGCDIYQAKPAIHPPHSGGSSVLAFSAKLVEEGGVWKSWSIQNSLVEGLMCKAKSLKKMFIE